MKVRRSIKRQTRNSINSDRLFISILFLGLLAVSSMIFYMHGKKIGQTEGHAVGQEYHYDQGEKSGFAKCIKLIYNRTEREVNPYEETL